MARCYLHRALLWGAALLLSGCVGLPGYNGIWFTQAAGPGPVTDTPLPRVEKLGRSRCISVLGLVAWGDASIAAAEKAGGVTRIHHVDFERMSYLGLFYSFTTVVYGE